MTLNGVIALFAFFTEFDSFQQSALEPIMEGNRVQNICFIDKLCFRCMFCALTMANLVRSKSNCFVA